MKHTPKKVLLPILLSCVFLLVSLLGWSSYLLLESRFINKMALDESDLISRGGRIFSRELGHIKSTTLFLRNSVYALSTTHDHPNEPDWVREDIIEIFSQFARTSPFISQVRWISLSGKELIRVNSHNGKITVVSSDQMQDKSDRYYFKKGAQTKGNSVYISPVDLNVENNQVVLPVEPTLRGAVAIEHHIKGVLVVNYNLTKLLERLRSLSDTKIFLDIVNPNGEWIISQNPQQEWQSSLENRPHKNYLKALYPEMWDSLLSNSEVFHLLLDGQLWSSSRVFIDDDLADAQVKNSSLLYFIARSRPHVLDEERYYLKQLIIAVAGLSFLVISFLLWWQTETACRRQMLMMELEQEKAQLKEANEELRKVNYQLVDLQNELVEASKLSALGMMVAGLAHEMNTPLGGVRMALSSLGALVHKESVSLTGPLQGSMVKTIGIAEKNLARAINLISSFKRITSDASGQDVEAFSVNDVIQDVLIVYRSLLKRQPGISIIKECESDIQMQGFPGILFQVIQNFIDNALQHGFKESKRGTIKIIVRSAAGYLILTVEDNGKGISDEVAGRLFEPFITTGRLSKHTGLGLHLVHQWVYKLMHGRIDVVSKEGQGSRFTAYIPLVQREKL